MENWEKVESIFHTALGLPSAERKPFLQRECAGDEKLLSDVESLITSFEKNSGFLDEPVFELGLGALGRKPETNYAGTTIGFYEIEEKIGMGGMGEVYKAFDTRLNRLVALKFLTESLENDNSARRQLVKEAQAAAALEHPNICAVHGIEQTDEHQFIVMQYVEGITLSEKIAGEETLSADEFKKLARQILSAVALAHSHGIIHRDLKPGNIMLTPDGQIKVLDFGLAKFVAPKQFVGRKNNPDSSIFSKKGLIIGTISYMSPEQLRGEKLDFQTDIFSLGIILYELAAGKNPFNRRSQAETIAAILSENPPPLKDTAPDFSENLQILVEKCLLKNKDERFQSTAQILVELDSTDKKNIVKPLFKRQSFWLKTALAAIFLIAFLGTIYFYNLRPSQKTLAVLPFTIENNLTEKEYLADGLSQNITDKLSEVSNIKTKNEYLTARYKGQNTEPQVAGKELNADAILTGKIQQNANGLVLEIKIFRTSDGVLIDTDEIQFTESDLVELPEKITLRILGKIESRLSDEDKRGLAKKDTESNEAKNYYMQGRFYLKRREDLDKAIQAFTNAKDIDQTYAKAWAGLADAYLSQSTPGAKGAITPEKSVALAKTAANQAIKLDNTLSEAYNSLGLIAMRYGWNWKEAEGYFRTAIQLDPEFLPARFGLIEVLGFQKRNDEALQEAEKIKEYDPLSISYELETGIIYYQKGDFQKAEVILSELSQRFPENMRVKYVLGYLFLKTNRINQALEIFEPQYDSEKQENKVYVAAPLGYAYAKSGRRDEALKIISELEKFGQDNYVPAQEKALIYLGLGNFDKVFENLELSCTEKFSSLPNWITDPIVDEIRTQPRYENIKKCVNL